MTRMGQLFLSLVALLVATTADAAEPFVRIVMPPATPYLAGQPINLEVQVLVPNFFMSPLQFPTLDIPGAVVTLSDDRALNFNETIGGETYSGIRKSYVIVPEQAGTFSLPPARFTFSYAAVPGQATPASVLIPAQTFEVRLPAGAMGPNGPLPLVPLEISQSWDRAPTGLQAGDTLTRTVSIFAKGMQAMMIPPPRLDTPNDVKAYPHDPVLTNEKTNGRDFAGGRRVDQVTYVFTRPGDYVFPAVMLDWYNAAIGKAEVAQTPEVTVNIVVAPDTAPAIAPEREQPSWLPPVDWASWLPRGLVAILIVAALAFAGARYLPQIRSSIAARREAYRQSEPAHFKRLRAACRATDRMAVYGAMTAWAQAAGITSISAWARRFGETNLVAEIDRLDYDLFSGRVAAADWRAASLETELVQARQHFLKRQVRGRKTMLPPLNPSWKSEILS